MKGMVRRVGGGVYTVALESGEIVEASLRGRLKLEERAGDQVVIGDRVRLDLIDGEAHVIEEVFPRETTITRSRFGGRTIKVLVANADRLLVVVAAARPKLGRAPAAPRPLKVAANGTRELRARALTGRDPGVLSAGIHGLAG